MEQFVSSGHLFDHSYSACSRRRSRGLTEQALSNTPAPEVAKVLGLVPVSASAPAEESRRVSRRLALKRKAKSVQVPTFESSVSAHPLPESPCPADPECPLLIHGHTVEEYQPIYHSVVDSMLTYPSGRPRPYSLKLGRRIKQRLWGKMEQPLICEIETSGGLLNYRESRSTRPYPPLIDVDVSKEPAPKTSPPFLFQAQPAVSAGAPPTHPQHHLLTGQAPKRQAADSSAPTPPHSAKRRKSH